MLKINYEERPFYSEIGYNEPCTKHLEIEFAEDAGMNEIIAEFIKVLYFAGYSRFNIKRFDDLKDNLINEGIIDDLPKT